MYVVLLILNIFLSLSAFAVIHGNDDRIEIHEGIRDQYYANRVGKLIAYDEESGVRKNCSASQISEKYILTAATCIINLQKGLPYKNVHYFPAFRGHQSKSPSRVFVEQAIIPFKFEQLTMTLRLSSFGNDIQLTEELLQHNLAIVPVFSDREQTYVGKEYGYLGVYLGMNSEHSLDLYTYPVDKKVSGYEKGTLWFESCHAKHLSENLAESDCDTSEGAEGAGIYQYSETHDMPFIVGVYSGEIDGRNIMTWLSKEVFSALRLIVDDNFSNQQYFNRIDVYSEKKFYLYAYNDCYLNLDLYVRMKSLGHSWWNTFNFSSLLPKVKTFISSTDHLVVVYRMMNKIADNNELTQLYGDIYDRDFDHFFIDRNLNSNFPNEILLNTQLDKDLYGDHYITLTCVDNI